MSSWLTGSELEMRRNALAWVEDRSGTIISRDRALGEQHTALDVLELLEEVDRLRALPTSIAPTPGIPDHLQLNMAKVREAIATKDRELAKLKDLLETAWGVIANASGGRWSEQSAEWNEAAERWRDAWHKTLRPEVSHG